MSMTHEDRLQMARDDLANPSLPAMKIHRQHTRLNPEMYGVFESEAIRLIGQGHTLFSQWMVANHVRYLYHMSFTPTGGDEEKFKVPNGVISIWARRFIVSYPQHDVFRIKRLSR